MKVSKSRKRRFAAVKLLIATTTVVVLTAGLMPGSINVPSHDGNPVLTVDAAAARTPILTQLPPDSPPPIYSSDVSITKSDSPDPVPVGDNLTYTIIIENDGPDNG